MGFKTHACNICLTTVNNFHEKAIYKTENNSASLREYVRFGAGSLLIWLIAGTIMSQVAKNEKPTVGF